MECCVVQWVQVRQLEWVAGVITTLLLIDELKHRHAYRSYQCTGMH